MPESWPRRIFRTIEVTARAKAARAKADRGDVLLVVGTVLALAIVLLGGALADYIRRVGPPPWSPEHRHLARIPFARQVFGGRWW